MEKGQLTVSFELKVDKDDIETLNNGVQKLNAVKFDGVGLLLKNRPACPEAIVYEQAKLDSFISQDLIFAKTIQDKKLNKEGDKVDKKANDALLAKQKEIVIAEFGEEVVKDWTDEDFLSEEKIEALRLSTKESLEEAEVVAETEEPKEEIAEEVKEEATEEVKEDAIEEVKEEVAEEKSEEAKTVVERETTMKQTEEYDETEMKTTTEVKEEDKVDGEPLVERTTKTEEKWFSSEEVDAMKADYEAKLSEKDSEITFLRENAKVIAELKAELGEFVKDFSDNDFLNSDKVEIARLKSENQKLKEASQTLETASEEQAEEVKEEVKDAVKEELPTGHEDLEPELSSMQLIELAIKNRCKK
jgi:S-DNA-T family DNA segregation ATPase FtsK/SpoIIIE